MSKAHRSSIEIDRSSFVDIDSLCPYVYLVLFDYRRFELDPRAITIIHFDC